MNSYIEVAKKCLEDEARAIMSLIPQLDEQFDEAVKLIMACRGKVILTGVGKSGHIAAKIAATLSSTGTPAFYINPLDVFHGDLGVMTSDDVVIGISNSGQTDELLRFVPFLLESKIPLIGISGNADSLLARNATIHLTVKVEQEACPLNLAPTSSTTATLAMGDALACALIEARQFRERDFARFHPGGSLGRRLRVTAGDVMRTDDLPVIPPEMKLGEAIIHVSFGKLGLCVAIDAGRIVGIITDGDVRRAMEKLQERFFNVQVQEVMTRTPVCVSPETKVSEILRILHERKIHAVLVVNEQHELLGVVDNFRCMI
ncbi:MAG: KpsF/GutQ family sugar-phosphate isomerase [Bacteroidaceae bacterium]|nr:KpsF/GutQ family sugar-phosphate isomerase [Bacteroidaceae bacterium]